MSKGFITRPSSNELDKSVDPKIKPRTEHIVKEKADKTKDNRNLTNPELSTIYPQLATTPTTSILHSWFVFQKKVLKTCNSRIDPEVQVLVFV